jgi:peptidoglycan/LPS O-acetylase OafA/YrhL
VEGVIEKGYLAVDFVFVLSRFILAYVYASEFDAGAGRYRRFLSLRLARIYPVHLLMLSLAIVVVLSVTGFASDAILRNTPRTIGSNLLLIHSWGIDGQLSWKFVSWSISAEWFAYLGVPRFGACDI